MSNVERLEVSHANAGASIERFGGSARFMQALLQPSWFPHAIAFAAVHRTSRRCYSSRHLLPASVSPATISPNPSFERTAKGGRSIPTLGLMRAMWSFNRHLKREAWIMVAAALIPLALGIFAVIVIPNVQHWLAAARCLDAGGTFNHDTGTCVVSASGTR